MNSSSVIWSTDATRDSTTVLRLADNTVVARRAKVSWTMWVVLIFLEEVVGIGTKAATASKPETLQAVCM